MILGSEGNFGIITDIVLRVRPIYEVRMYNSIIFPDFDHGLAFMREMGQSGCWPASIRTVDNLQFKFGYALKPAVKGWYKKLINGFKKMYLLNVKNINPDTLVLTTLVFEGTRK
jgi:alkyldihydroxyacetonephosphate synthase